MPVNRSTKPNHPRRAERICFDDGSATL
jgi:hypothetical protein